MNVTMLLRYLFVIDTFNRWCLKFYVCFLWLLVTITKICRQVMSHETKLLSWQKPVTIGPMMDSQICTEKVSSRQILKHIADRKRSGCLAIEAWSRPYLCIWRKCYLYGSHAMGWASFCKGFLAVYWLYCPVLKTLSFFYHCISPHRL